MIYRLVCAWCFFVCSLLRLWCVPCMTAIDDKTGRSRACGGAAARAIRRLSRCTASLRVLLTQGSTRFSTRAECSAAEPPMHRLELSMSRNLSPCLPKAGPCTTAQIRQDAFWGGESGDECEDAMGRRAMCAALDSSSTLQKQICEISTLWLRSQSVSHYHTPSRELMAHTLTLLTRVRVRRVSLTKVNIE